MLVLKIIIAIGFLLAGSAKLLSAKPIVEQFEEFGLAPWMMYAVGTLEVAGVIGLFIEPLTFWA
ncbi:MAG: DoxX family protein, partial [Candidatus Promineifilaceae bacterium]